MGLTPRQKGEERDRRIVELVAQLGYVRPAHVARLICDGHLVVARRRLLQLTRAGILARCETGRNEAFVYHAPGRRPAGAAVQHALVAADVYAALAGTQQPGRAELVAWHAEYEASDAYRADALLLVRLGSQAAAVFLEIDLGTERPAAVARKVQALAAYRASGAYREATWWRAGLHVAMLVVAPMTRAEHLRPVLSAAAAREGLVAGVANLAELQSRSWMVIEHLVTGTTQPAAATSTPSRPQVERAPGPPPGTASDRRCYTPAWQRSPEAPRAVGGIPEMGVNQANVSGGFVATVRGRCEGGAG